jgi:hypothetical protein
MDTADSSRTIDILARYLRHILVSIATLDRVYQWLSDENNMAYIGYCGSIISLRLSLVP